LPRGGPFKKKKGGTIMLSTEISRHWCIEGRDGSNRNIAVLSALENEKRGTRVTEERATQKKQNEQERDEIYSALKWKKIPVESRGGQVKRGRQPKRGNPNR